MNHTHIHTLRVMPPFSQSTYTNSKPKISWIFPKFFLKSMHISFVLETFKYNVNVNVSWVNGTMGTCSRLATAPQSAAPGSGPYSPVGVPYDPEWPRMARACSEITQLGHETVGRNLIKYQNECHFPLSSRSRSVMYYISYTMYASPYIILIVITTTTTTTIAIIATTTLTRAIVKCLLCYQKCSTNNRRDSEIETVINWSRSKHIIYTSARVQTS